MKVITDVAMKTVVIQSFSHWLVGSHLCGGNHAQPTPWTKDVLLSSAHLEAEGHQSIISNQDELLREAADVYLGRKPIAVSRTKANTRNLCLLTNLRFHLNQ